MFVTSTYNVNVQETLYLLKPKDEKGHCRHFACSHISTCNRYQCNISQVKCHREWKCIRTSLEPTSGHATNAAQTNIMRRDSHVRPERSTKKCPECQQLRHIKSACRKKLKYKDKSETVAMIGAADLVSDPQSSCHSASDAATA